MGSRSAAGPAGEFGVPPPVRGLRRSQVQVLAALARAPLGLRSARAVARAAALSPTAARAALRDLVDLGLVDTAREVVAEGTARTADIVYANLAHPRWPELAPLLARVRPAVHPVADLGRGVPARYAHVFWNAPVHLIDLARQGPYVARRVLLDGDTQALAWAAGALTATDWQEAASGRGLDPRHRAVAENLAAAQAPG